MNSNKNKKRILITMGDPAGIGPEVIIKALSDRNVSKLADIAIIGDLSVINRAKKLLRSKAEFSVLDMHNVPQENFSYGVSRPSFGRAAIEYVDKALRILKSGGADALVTAPLNKASVASAHLHNFKGHTEYLASKTRTKEVAMMFVGEALKITLVTRHVALKDVARSISTVSVYNTIMLTADSLEKYFRIKNQRIGVAGLNPHAGDEGLFGDEEERLIKPAVKKALKKVKNIYGPIPPDAVFYEAYEERLDAVVAMYHDQALAPFKMLYFKNGVNLTIGLPFIRTSPDHGTAFDIAGRGIADPTSMKEAIILACRLSNNQCLRKPS